MKFLDLNNVVTDGRNYAVVDKTAKINAGDTAYSGDMGFYLVTRDEVSYANQNHWKVTHRLNMEPIKKD